VRKRKQVPTAVAGAAVAAVAVEQPMQMTSCRDSGIVRG
jgi:hypothetical protein